MQRAILASPSDTSSPISGASIQIIHLWATRIAKTAPSVEAPQAGDQAWGEFVPKIHRLMMDQEGKILAPASFSPVR